MNFELEYEAYEEYHKLHEKFEKLKETMAVYQKNLTAIPDLPTNPNYAAAYQQLVQKIDARIYALVQYEISGRKVEKRYANVLQQISYLVNTFVYNMRVCVYQQNSFENAKKCFFSFQKMFDDIWSQYIIDSCLSQAQVAQPQVA